MGIIGVFASIAVTTAAGVWAGIRFVDGHKPKCDICRTRLIPMGDDKVMDCPNDFCELSYQG
ncbi:hypothetical protein [Arthrobacter sp. UYEF36]|uniref:hypothetical protein n=1 Tax=Arthrobacter sp. UYEF36 TaxID=1756366 RepID=UPI0033994A65